MDEVKRNPRLINYIIFIGACLTLACFTYFKDIRSERTQVQLAVNTKALPALTLSQPYTHTPAAIIASAVSTPPVATQVSAPPQNTLPASTHTETYTIRKGETLADLLHRAHLPSTLWISLLKSQKAAHYLEHLEEKQSIVITKDTTNQFVSLNYAPNLSTTVQVYLQNHKPHTIINQKPLTKTVAFKSAVIGHSLKQAEVASGLPATLQHQLDQMIAAGGLAQYVHPGDHINILYHEYFVGDQKDHPGNIVAAEITHGTQKHRIVRFTAPNHHTGIYMPNGEGTEPAFLRAPVNYHRIGSGFSYSRMDPVIHRVHPHLGVDLDAPRGTPVKAIGDGVVVFCNRMNGYGNAVMIRYNNTYRTLYAHLEKFSTHLHPNEIVKKGQIVGYVGSTGWSTGPHLHYSLYKNGTAVNPLTAPLPLGNGVPGRYRQDFLYKENHWFNEMRLFENTQPKTMVAEHNATPIAHPAKHYAAKHTHHPVHAHHTHSTKHHHKHLAHHHHKKIHHTVA